MAVQSGLGDGLLVAQFNIGGDVGSLGRISGGTEPLDVTPITSSGSKRIGGKRDGGIEFNCFFNDATDAEHDALKALPTTDRIVTYQRGTSLGSPAASIVAKQINYDWERGDDGSLIGTVEALANGYGLEWGRQLTAGTRTDTTATNGASVDFAASTAFGARFFLHVFAFTGASATVKIQESSDDGSGDAWADVTGGGFTAVSGVTSERIATSSALTVERYLRCVTTGTFSNLAFTVVAMKPDVATVF